MRNQGNKVVLQGVHSKCKYFADLRTCEAEATLASLLAALLASLLAALLVALLAALLFCMLAEKRKQCINIETLL